MEIRDFASKFKVSFLTKDLQIEADLRLSLQKLGFQTTAFSATALDCHVLAIDTQFLEDSLSNTLEKALTQNPDVRVILIAKHHQFATLIDYKKYQTDMILDSADASLKEKLLWEIEKSARFLYLYYQNEQILKDYLDVQKQLDKSLLLASTLPNLDTASKSTPQAQIRSRSIPSELNFTPNAEAEVDVQGPTSLIRGLYRNEDLDSVLSFFFQHAPHEKKLFFRFYSLEMKLKVTLAEGFQLDDVRVLECSVDHSELRNLVGLKFATLPEKLEDLLVRAFQDPHFLIFPLIFSHQLVGFYVFRNSQDETQFRFQHDYLETVGRAALVQMEMFWSRALLMDLETRDKKTHLFNEKYYRKKLSEEVQRAQRMKNPLSLLVFEIDNYDGLKTLLGDQIFEEKLAIFCGAIVQTGRPHDLSCRIADKTFSLVLPYCSRKNAVLRAERLMKALSSHVDLRESFQTVLSFGVSEYPTLCHSAEELDATATKIMKKIQERGGNRVGVYRVNPDFSPSFRIEAEE